MIKINLLPEELKREEASFSKIGFSLEGRGKLIRNIVISAVLILAAGHVTLFFVGNSSSAAFKKLTSKYSKLSPDRKEYESLKAELAFADRKGKAIDSLMANRFSWARELNSLSECMTQGIWLTEISYEEKSGEVTVQAAAKRGPMKGETMKSETIKTNLRYLNMSGYATSMGEQGTSLVGRFIKSMKDDPSFYSDFSEIKLESIKSEKVLDQEAMSFKITCLFKNR